MDIKQLVEKYDRPAPRYTCYPDVPYWVGKNADSKKWLKAIKKVFDKSNQTKGISLYFHMPFCESLCTFCGFEKRITNNHYVEEIYIEALLKQWQIYREHFGSEPIVQSIYMGGGTPTFFSPENLERLFSTLSKTYAPKDGFEAIFEGHPNSTKPEHLQLLHEFGFRQVSYGIQDFDEQVQIAINRIQSFEAVKEVTEKSREVGFSTVKFDLIYGLPFQTPTTVKNTISKVARLMPDVIAFYSYMHVPWERPSQKSFKENSLPQGFKKQNLFEIGKEELLALGYEKVGLDHFALPGTKFHQAYQEEKLHRSVSGYSIFDTDMTLGLGAIALSDVGCAYAQNIISVEDFHDRVFNGELPLAKTYFLSKEDCLLKEFIEDIMCKAEANWSQELFDSLDSEAKVEVIEIQKEGLIDVSNKGLKVTEKGMPFLRNICQVFDAQHHRRVKSHSEAQFSGAI